MGRGSVFHLSFYVTLGLAAVCLGFAEAFFLWWIPYFVTVVGVVGYLAWRFEGRWQLTEHGANTLGIVIAFAMLGWIILQLPRSEDDVLSTGLPWPAGLLPHLGPLLMVLTAVKLFRPKTAPDFWVLQILGIMMVTLASVLAGEIEHGVWLFLYLVSLLWCLSHFCKVQEEWANLSDQARGRMPLFPTAPAGGGAETRSRWGGLGGAVVWSIMGFALGLGLFYLAPRHTSVQWIPHKLTVAAVVRNPYGFGGGMDLNGTGKVQLSDEVAFTVTGIDADDKSVELPAGMYWRGETFDSYQNGRWFSSAQNADGWPELGGPTVRTRMLSVPSMNPPLPPPSERPKDVPANRTYLSIRAHTGPLAGLILAEPFDVTLGNGISPYVVDGPTRRSFFVYHEGTDLVGMADLKRRGVYSYGQVVDLRRRNDPQPADSFRYYRETVLVQSPPPELLTWARELVDRLPGLTREQRSRGEDGHIASAHHRAVAQALSRHFSDSGEYLYTLNRRRVDLSKDPNVDFLMNVKEGHCELYASGLAMTLRAVGIPSRIVHGFRGVERVEDAQDYVIRHNQAHSWVQVIVAASGNQVAKDGAANPPPDEPQNPKKFEWILLDPTPSQEVQLSRWQVYSEWFALQFRHIRSAFYTGVLNYGSDQQKATWAMWWESVSSLGAMRLRGGLILIGAGCLGWGLIGRHLYRRAINRWKTGARTAAEAPWLREALGVLQRVYGLSLSPSQTLREFANAAHPRLPAEAAVAVDTLAQLANQAAFSGQSLSAAEHRALAGSLAVLRGGRAAAGDHVG